MLDTILTKCDERYSRHKEQRYQCTYGDYCPHDCGACLEYIHYPQRIPDGAPPRKYDCVFMADYYSCKYSCRYTSEMIYEIRLCKDLIEKKRLKVLSIGCGPCTDLFAIDYLKRNGELHYDELDYRGVDYSKDVWSLIHSDIKAFETDKIKINFWYNDICAEIHAITQGGWRPDLIVFQYVFSDMHKHSGEEKTTDFINAFAEYYNDKVEMKTYVILNDINLGKGYNGGRDYFDQLRSKLKIKMCWKAHFHNDTRNNTYPYGDELASNSNFFNSIMDKWQKYAPYNTCASALMMIKKEQRP